jgi:hypothetical protein
MIVKSGSVAYVTRCNMVEVLPRISNNCREEIPVPPRNNSLFVDQISYVIKTVASNTQCNDIGTTEVEHRWEMVL